MTRAPRNDRGATTAGVLVAVGLLMVAFVTLANLVAYQYGKGALRAAAEQAARAGSRASATEQVCEQRGRESLAAVLGGKMGNGATITCTDNGVLVTATATGSFKGWLAAIPDWNVSVSSTVRKEQKP